MEQYTSAKSTILSLLRSVIHQLRIEYSSLSQCSARVRYNHYWLDEPSHASPNCVHALLSRLNPCSIASSNRHIPSIVHPESSHRHPQRVAPCPTNLRSRHTFIRRRFALSACNSAPVQCYQVLLRWVDIATELRGPSSGG